MESHEERKTEKERSESLLWSIRIYTNITYGLIFQYIAKSHWILFVTLLLHLMDWHATHWLEYIFVYLFYCVSERGKILVSIIIHIFVQCRSQKNEQDDIWNNRHIKLTKSEHILKFQHFLLNLIFSDQDRYSSSSSSFSGIDVRCCAHNLRLWCLTIAWFSHNVCIELNYLVYWLNEALSLHFPCVYVSVCPFRKWIKCQLTIKPIQYPHCHLNIPMWN